MSKKKLICSHYTVAQMTRILDTDYNHIRAIITRVPGCTEPVYGTTMVKGSFIPKLRQAKRDIEDKAAR